MRLLEGVFKAFIIYNGFYIMVSINGLLVNYWRFRVWGSARVQPCKFASGCIANMDVLIRALVCLSRRAH